MRFTTLAGLAMLTGGVAGYYWPARADSYVPMDRPITIGGVQTVCTGIGDEAQHDPRWFAYPIRIEFSNDGAQYLSGAHVVLSSADGKPLAALDCAGAWVLFKLEPGNYRVDATLLYNQGGGSRSAAFSPPATGQRRVVLQFKVSPNQ
jgi:hypothetical protein